MNNENKFLELLGLNVNDKTEKKKTGNTELTYLSWSFAWGEFVKVYPNATYEIVKNEQGLPYFHDESGAMVYTKVTAGGITHEMWLPVMDGANNAMKTHPYTYQVREYVFDSSKHKSVPTGKMIDKKVEAYTMFDINKTIMRCLVKNLAMFGLGLYIYAGEDLPDTEDNGKQTKTTITQEQVLELERLLIDANLSKDTLLNAAKIARLEDMLVMDFVKNKDRIADYKKRVEEKKNVDNKA